MTEADVQMVCAVVVAYRPEPLVLRDLLHAVSMQVGAIVVVDNTPHGEKGAGACDVPQGTYLLPQHGNVGLAKAQNAGIDWARQYGFRHVLLLDQDSLPGEGMVVALLEALEHSSHMQKVAAVGPCFHDLREDRVAPFVRIGFPLNRKLWCEREWQTVPCDFLIGSGSLVPMDVLDVVGDMDAGLFIDNVDLEWCFRARAKGFDLHGACAAVMHHRLGDARHTLPLGLGQVVVHGPVRLYYMMRNRVRLYCLPHTPRIWIAQDVPRVVLKLFLFGVLIGPRLRNLRFMLRGLVDGVRGRTGACPWQARD